MNIVITGGTGFVGTNLTQKLLARGDQVTVISSSGKSTLEQSSNYTVLQADTTETGTWQDEIVKFDVLVNLTGRSIFNYWSESYKKKIYDSRVKTTRNLVQALGENTQTVLLSASAVGYYGDSGEIVQDEQSSAGSDFLAEVSKDWEKEAYRAQKKGARVATMRFGVVLGKGGGAIETMKTPFKLGMGGPIGNGKQWFPWIHIDDLTSAIIFLMEGGDLSGPFNFTAPEQVRQKEFAKTLAGVLGRPAILPAPSFLMKTLAGDFGKSLLQGQKAVPKALQECGFVFRYGNLEEALLTILA